MAYSFTKGVCQTVYGQLAPWMARTERAAAQAGFGVAFPPFRAGYNRLGFSGDGFGAQLVRDEIAPQTYITQLEGVVDGVTELLSTAGDQDGSDACATWWNESASPALASAMTRDEAAQLVDPAINVIGDAASKAAGAVTSAGSGLFIAAAVILVLILAVKVKS